MTIIVIQGNFRTAIYLNINKYYLLIKLSTQVLKHPRAKLQHNY